MSGQVRLKGKVVERKMPDGTVGSSYEGLYLLMDDGSELELIQDSMATQMPVDMLHRQSRSSFEPYLGMEITVSGYRSGQSIFGAFIENEPDIEGNAEWTILPPEK